jgi:uncharacterized membrane protein YeiH
MMTVCGWLSFHNGGVFIDTNSALVEGQQLAALYAVITGAGGGSLRPVIFRE